MGKLVTSDGSTQESRKPPRGEGLLLSRTKTLKTQGASEEAPTQGRSCLGAGLAVCVDLFDKVQQSAELIELLVERVADGVRAKSDLDRYSCHPSMTCGPLVPTPSSRRPSEMACEGVLTPRFGRPDRGGAETLGLACVAEIGVVDADAADTNAQGHARPCSMSCFTPSRLATMLVWCSCARRATMRSSFSGLPTSSRNWRSLFSIGTQSRPIRPSLPDRCLGSPSSCSQPMLLGEPQRSDGSSIDAGHARSASQRSPHRLAVTNEEFPSFGSTQEPANRIFGALWWHGHVSGRTLVGTPL